MSVDTSTVSASPSARFRRNHGGQAYQQLSGLSFYWNTSNGGHDNTIVYGASANSSLKFTQATGSAFNDTLTINSSGNAEFSGNVTADSLTVDTSAGQLDVEALGGSSVKVKSDGSLKIEATGGAVDLLHGSAEVLNTLSDGISVPNINDAYLQLCLLYTSPSPRD